MLLFFFSFVSVLNRLTQAEIQGLAKGFTLTGSDFINFLHMSLVLMYRNIAMSCSNIDIRIGGRNIAVHLCIYVLLKP